MDKICPTCGNSFKTYPSLNRIYCSFNCYHQGGNKRCRPPNKITKVCAWCNQPVTRPAADFHNSKTFCNYLCMAEWQSKYMCKENHPRWNGGNRGNNRGIGWKKAKKIALKHSNGKCKMCRKPANTVHHKIPVRCFTNPSDAHSQSNLIVLCKSCHPKAEKVFRLTLPLLNLVQWKDS